MTQAAEFSGIVTDGRLPAAVSGQVAECIRRLEGRRVIVAVKEQKRRRSTSQNAYYWGVVVRLITDAFRDAGNMVDADDVHQFLKLHVGKLTQVLVTPEGEVFKGPGSTAKLGTQEMEVYLEMVRAWAADVLDTKIPLPHEGVL